MRHQSFRVAPIGGFPYLLPPDYTDNNNPGRDISVRVDGVTAPLASRRASGCSIQVPQFSMAKARGSSVIVRVRPADLFAGGGIVRAYRGAFDAFRTELSRLEERGCLKPGGGRVIAERVAESLPLPVMETLFYTYGYEPFRGYCEVHPDMRIHAQRALLARGPDGKERLVRIDRALYSVTREHGGEGLRFHLSERSGTEAALPGIDELRQPFYRFFYHIKFNDLSGKPQRTAVLLGAGSLRVLEQTTASLWKDPDLTCGRLTGIDCVKSPAGQIVTAEVPVRLNGKRTVIPVSFTIGDVLRDRQALRPGKPVPKLELRRQYRGRLARVEFLTPEPVLGLPLRSGDRLDWDAAAGQRTTALSPAPR
jgi:hypothetical protein